MPSTVIKQFSYDPENRILQVLFVSGLCYEYLQVPEELYLAMKASRAKGIYFNENIKGKFSFKKMESGSMDSGSGI